MITIGVSGPWSESAMPISMCYMTKESQCRILKYVIEYSRRFRGEIREKGRIGVA